MRFMITIKAPDCFYEGIREAAKRSIKNNTSETETKILTQIRQQEIEEALSEWVRYGECIDIEFDTDRHTAIVLKSKSY